MLWYSTGLVQDFDYVKNFGQGEIRNDKYGALQSPYYWVTGAKKILQSGINDIYVKSTFHVDYDGDMPIKTNNDGTCFNFDDIIYVRYQKNGNENCINVYWYAKEIASYVIHQDSFFKLEAHLQCSSSKGNITIFLNDAEIINTSLVCNNELKYIIFGDKYTNDTYNLYTSEIIMSTDRIGNQSVMLLPINAYGDIENVKYATFIGDNPDYINNNLNSAVNVTYMCSAKFKYNGKISNFYVNMKTVGKINVGVITEVSDGLYAVKYCSNSIIIDNNHLGTIKISAGIDFDDSWTVNPSDHFAIFCDTATINTYNDSNNELNHAITYTGNLFTNMSSSNVYNNTTIHMNALCQYYVNDVSKSFELFNDISNLNDVPSKIFKQKYSYVEFIHDGDDINYGFKDVSPNVVNTIKSIKVTYDMIEGSELVKALGTFKIKNNMNTSDKFDLSSEITRSSVQFDGEYSFDDFNDSKVGIKVSKS